MGGHAEWNRGNAAVWAWFTVVIVGWDKAGVNSSYGGTLYVMAL